jgi:hypothetical protein
LECLFPPNLSLKMSSKAIILLHCKPRATIKDGSTLNQLIAPRGFFIRPHIFTHILSPSFPIGQ